MIEIINKYGIYGKYIFLICMIICVIFFLKKKSIMPINNFKPLSIIIIILGILLFVGVGIAVITIVTSNNESNWYLKKMNYNQLLKYSKGDSQTIAFIDSGISDAYAKKLGDRIVGKYNVLDDSGNTNDYNGHGTEMVSIACGDGYNEVYGIAPKAKIIIVKAISDEGLTNNDYLLKALQYISNSKATIVNISLGVMNYSEQVVKQIAEMQRQGITILAAAGDYDNKDLLFPASLETVIAVQSINEKGILWEECNITMDKKESIVKYPGVDIESLTVENDKLISTISSGTSQSTAIASGYAALIKDYYKKLHKLEIEYDYLLELMKNNTNKSYVKSFDLIKKDNRR